MDRQKLEAIIRAIDGPAASGRTLVLADNLGDGWLIQCRYVEGDVDTGLPEVQRSRRWFVSRHATETEVVETAFECLRRSLEHQLREAFTYRGRRVFSRHFDVKARIDMCDAKRFEERKPE